LWPELLDAGSASLRVRVRHPHCLPDAVFDVCAGIAYLRRQGIEAVALTGHSFGGAVVIQAAARSPAVRTVVTRAIQSYGVEPVAGLAHRCSILSLHGAADHVLPAESSQYTHRIALEPKRLILYPGAGHGLDEVAAAVYHTVRQWIVTELARAAEANGFISRPRSRHSRECLRMRWSLKMRGTSTAAVGLICLPRRGYRLRAWRESARGWGRAPDGAGCDR
jgi:fermentation-respiration switch protein FrsA (DUF1100 family)